MANELQGKRVAVLATDGVEEVEYLQPRQAVEQAGGAVELVSTHGGEIQSVNHDIQPSRTYRVDMIVDQADPDAYDALLLPGGAVNPDRLRVDPIAMRFVRAFFDSGKPVGAICHGPWSLVEAGVLLGRVVTSWPSLQTDILNAGGIWVDEQVHTDQELTTSRKPDDLPAFTARVVSEFAAGPEYGQSMAT